jgi:hypothetical protein
VTDVVMLVIRGTADGAKVRDLQHPTTVDDAVTGLEIAVRPQRALMDVLHALLPWEQNTQKEHVDVVFMWATEGHCEMKMHSMPSSHGNKTHKQCIHVVFMGAKEG